MTKSKLSDMELLSRVVAGQRQTQIAQDTGLTVQTISRRINDKGFQDALHQYRKMVINGTLTSLTQHCQKAVDTLGGLLNSKNEYVKLSASKEIISLTQDITLQFDLLTELEELKENQRYLNDNSDNYC